MRWIAYLLLAYIITGLQMGLSGFLNVGQASPNLILPIVIFVAINARREEALAGAFLLGCFQDLFTQEPLGLYAFTYGLVALFALGAQPAVYRDHPLTHFFVTLLAALFTGAVVAANHWVRDSFSPMITTALGRALYTAILSPILLFPLSRIKFFFGFRSAKPHAVAGML